MSRLQLSGCIRAVLCCRLKLGAFINLDLCPILNGQPLQMMCKNVQVRSAHTARARPIMQRSRSRSVANLVDYGTAHAGVEISVTMGMGVCNVALHAQPASVCSCAPAFLPACVCVGCVPLLCPTD